MNEIEQKIQTVKDLSDELVPCAGQPHRIVDILTERADVLDELEDNSTAHDDRINAGNVQRHPRLASQIACERAGEINYDMLAHRNGVSDFTPT